MHILPHLFDLVVVVVVINKQARIAVFSGYVSVRCLSVILFVSHHEGVYYSK